jgi:hypothetical protein
MSAPTGSTSVSDANNQGLAYLEKGFFSNALHHLTHALQCARRNFQHQENVARTTYKYQETRCFRRHILLLPPSEIARRELLMPLPTTMLVGPAARSPAEESRTTFRIHTQAIRPISGLAFSKDAMANDKICSAIVVFNLALCSHLQGLRRDDRQSCLQSLRKAKSLYSQSFTLLADTIMTECDCTVGSTGNALIDLLVMALLNNLALLHYVEFRELSESQQVFAHLIQFATSVQNNGYYKSNTYDYCASSSSASSSCPPSNNNNNNNNTEDTINNGILDQQIDAFLQNATCILLGIIPSAVAAAAA